MLRDIGKHLDGGEESIENFVFLSKHLDDALAKGNLNEARDVLEQGIGLFREMLPLAKSKGLRRAFSNTIESSEALVQKLSSGTGTMKDVEEFLRNAATGFEQVLVAVIDDVISTIL